MKLANNSAKLLVGLALSFCLVSGSRSADRSSFGDDEEGCTRNPQRRGGESRSRTPAQPNR